MSIIATVIGLVILLLRKITHKKISPKCSYIIWLVFILALICPVSIPSRISIYNYIDVERVKHDEKEISNDILSIEEDASDLKQEINSNYRTINRNDLIFSLPYIWLLIAMIKLSKAIFTYVALNKLIGNHEIEDERMIGILESCKEKLKIKKNIKLIEQDIIKTPSTMGIFNVKIFIPDEILELDEVAITDIMMHELSHYKRKDNFLNIFIIVAKCIYWFNPITNYLFKHLKIDMELATDEMAVSDMEEEEKLKYCKVIVYVAHKCNSKVEVVLGLADEVKVIENRIDMVLMKEDFKKRARPIMIATTFIVLFMWLIFYPTSYGMFDIPRLFVELEDGSVVETTKIEKDENDAKIAITVKENENLKLITKGGRCDDFVVYSKTNLITQKSNISAIDVTAKEISCFQKGEYIYQFTLKHGKNKNTSYAIKIIVE